MMKIAVHRPARFPVMTKIDPTLCGGHGGTLGQTEAGSLN